MFGSILTPDYNYTVPLKASVLRNQFKCIYLKIKKYLVKFFLFFSNLHNIQNTLKKKISLKC